MDQHVVSTWSEQPDDVGGGFRVESGSYSALPGQVGYDVGSALSMLRQVGIPESARVRIDSGCAPDRFVDARQAAVDLCHKLGIQSQVLAWIGLCSNRLGARSFRERNRLVIADDRDIKSGLQELGFSAD
jgi:hypothetical protein